MHIIMILANLAHFRPTLANGFGKMILKGIFYDLGPPKRYQWQPNTWANIIWGQLGGNLVKNRCLEG